MKIVKIILLGLAGLIGLFLVVALFLKKDFAVERDVVINRPVAEVFDYVKSLKNQANWSTWIRNDPNIKMDYRGDTDGTPGFVAAWDGNSQVGKGETEIKSVTEGQRIDMEIRFIEPFASVSPAYLQTEAVGEGQTRVRWGISGRMIYPMNGMSLFMAPDDVIGGEYEKSLTNLKNLLEQAGATTGK